MKPRFTKHGRRIVLRGSDKAEHRSRRYKVERLPAKARATIFRGYADGEPYEKIEADLAQMGYRITKGAIGNYWRDIWRDEHQRLREAYGNTALLKEALQLEPESRSRQVAEELLYTLVFQAFPLLRKEGPMSLLREARGFEKRLAEAQKDKGKLEEGGEVDQGRAIRRRWRELYGLEGGDDDAEEKDEPDS